MKVNIVVEGTLRFFVRQTLQNLIAIKQDGSLRKESLRSHYACYRKRMPLEDNGNAASCMEMVCFPLRTRKIMSKVQNMSIGGQMQTISRGVYCIKQLNMVMAITQHCLHSPLSRLP